MWFNLHETNLETNQFAKADITHTTMEYQTITIDYSKSLAEMIEGGEYDLVNKRLLSGIFPTNRSGLITLETKIFDREREFERYWNVTKLRFRPATIEELVVYTSRKLYIEYSAGLVALGSSTRVNALPFVAHYREYRFERSVGLFSANFGYEPETKFLGVREVQPKS